MRPMLPSLLLTGCAAPTLAPDPLEEVLSDGPRSAPDTGPAPVARFEGPSTRVHAPWPGAPEAGVTLAAWGGSGAPVVAEATTPRTTPTGAELVRDGIVERWTRVPAGLEHSFVVEHPPEARLVVELALEGAEAAITEDGASAHWFSSGSGLDLWYSHLRAHDAVGRPLRAWMTPTHHGLRLNVDTVGALPPVTVDPLVTTTAWTLESDHASAKLGGSLATGDIDGDGFEDLVMGSVGVGVGAVYGSATGLSATFDWTLVSTGNGFAETLATADVNGDGFDDVLVGSPKERGTLQVFHGSATGPSIVADAVRTTTVANGQLATALASAGDVNGDGYDDVVVGVPLWTDGITVQGAVWVYDGSPTGIGPTPAWTWSSGVAGGKLGRAAAGVGDTNHDGYDDVLVGSPSEGAGAARLFLGGPTGLAPAPSWEVSAPAGTAYFGSQVAGACDVNGDGWSDLVVAAPNEYLGQAAPPSVFVYEGSATGPSTTPDTALTSTSLDFAWVVACVGDVDGDGTDDLAVGASGASTASVYLGWTGGLREDPVVVVTSTQPDARLGSAVAGLDTNADGLSDLAVGVPSWNGGLPSEGRVQVTLGASFADGDVDGVPDGWDLCPGVNDPEQPDLDHDGVGDGCDTPELELGGVLSAGVDVTWIARGVLPGEPVRFGAGLGAPTPGPCDLGGHCLMLGSSPIDLGTAVADATGTATLRTSIPATANVAGPWTVQAVVARGGSSAASVPLVVSTPSIDQDGDGLTDAEESRVYTDPTSPDTDLDGRSDLDEVVLGSDPMAPDTDGDGVLDGADACDGAPDTDLDGDGTPEACDTCPGVADPTQADTDGDGFGDACDVSFVPSVSDVRLAPAAPFGGEQPRCRYTFHDQDGDADASTVVWAIDGAVVGTGEVCPVAVQTGQRVTCRVVPQDGTSNGVPVTVAAVAAAPPTRGNLLVLVADDLGADDVAFYGTGAVYPQTPRLDALAAEGVTFTHAYSNPLCSASRSAIQTGRYPSRDGVTAALDPRGGVSLPLSAVTLPEMLDQGTAGAYSSSMLGKWHLGNIAQDMWNQPTLQGYDWWAGMVTGFETDSSTDGLPQNYYDWEKTTNGVSARTATYATVDIADDAIARMGTMPEPWLMVVAFAAPHAPLQWPPPALYHDALGANPDIQRYHAMIEALDTEMGRVLDAMTPAQRANTTIVFTGDNGPWEDVISPPLPSDRGKGTVYEGGIHVPLVVAGPWVDQPGLVTDALVQQVDLYATLAGMADVAYPVGGEDSVSFLPVLRDTELPSDRSVVYSETFQPPGPPPYGSGQQAVTDGRWKLVRFVNGPDELYDLENRGHEGTNLLDQPLDPEAGAAYDRLRTDLDHIYD